MKRDNKIQTLKIQTLIAKASSSPELLDRLLRVAEAPERHYGRMILGPEDAAAAFSPLLQGLVEEATAVLAVDIKNRALSSSILARGSSRWSLVDPHQILAWAFRQGPTGAHKIFLAHNHPSGDLTPSAQDRDVTRKVRLACEAAGIPLLDHLIITDEGFSSVMAWL